MYIKAIVTVGVKKESIIQKSPDQFIISVKEKAEKNMANKKIIELLASYFNISKSKIRIINGHHHPHKLLVVEDKI
ncbi:MAG: DUF167 family protein [Candidatus Paceibacterota bacterium]|jgi:uncharacterized protein YggU (UPF0235/DUF167 family)